MLENELNLRQLWVYDLQTNTHMKKQKNTNLNLIIKQVISYECVMCVYIQISVISIYTNISSLSKK